MIKHVIGMHKTMNYFVQWFHGNEILKRNGNEILKRKFKKERKKTKMQYEEDEILRSPINPALPQPMRRQIDF